jgi:hypothetical protein
VYRLPYRDITLIKTRSADRNGNSEYFVLHCKSVVEMAQNSPYVFRKLDATQESGEYAFSLSYVSLAKFMPLLTQVTHNNSEPVYVYSSFNDGGDDMIW